MEHRKRGSGRFPQISICENPPNGGIRVLFTLAYPRLTVEVGMEIFQVEAKVAEEPERTCLYDKMVEMMPGFADYRQKTERVIPVIELTPVK